MASERLSYLLKISHQINSGSWTELRLPSAEPLTLKP